MAIYKWVEGAVLNVIATNGKKENKEDLQAIEAALKLKADEGKTAVPAVETPKVEEIKKEGVPKVDVTTEVGEGVKVEVKVDANTEEAKKKRVSEIIAKSKLKKQAKEIEKKIISKKIEEMKARVASVEVKAETLKKEEVMKKIKARKQAKGIIARRIEARSKEESGRILAKKKVEDVKKKKKEEVEKGKGKKKSIKDIVSAMKARLDAKKNEIKAIKEPKFDVAVLEKKSPKITDEEVHNAPQTKSKLLIEMAGELKEIAEAQELKLDAIKQFTKEIEAQLNEDLKVAEIKKNLKDTLDKVLEKNEELKTSTEKAIRLNESEILWFDRTFGEVTELEKLSEQDKGKYEQLKKDITLKEKEVKELEAKVTKTSDVADKIRLVIIKNQNLVKSAEADVASVLGMYDEANGLMSGIIEGIDKIVNGIAEWFKGIFKK